MKSIHNFKPGDRVAYSVTLAAVPEKNLQKRHIKGRGVVTQVFPKHEEPTYEIRTSGGHFKVFYAHELRKL